MGRKLTFLTSQLLNTLACTTLSAIILATTSLDAQAMDVPITSVQISTFKDAQPGEMVDSLIWWGGLEMTSDMADFGGLSGLTFTGLNQQFAMVSDAGEFVSGQLIYNQTGNPLEIVSVQLVPIQNSKGEALPRAFARDAEAIETIYRDGEPAAVRVGFENLTRVADFSLISGRPDGPAREVVIPEWLGDLRTNKSLEAVCIAPDASPIAGSTLLITEAARDNNGMIIGFMLGRKDRGRITLAPTPGMNPTDCAFLPNGDLLVLERGIGFLSFTMQLRRITADQVKPNANLQGEVLLSASGGNVDNMEGLAVRKGPDGSTRITIISDDNFNDWERNLWLEFALPE